MKYLISFFIPIFIFSGLSAQWHIQPAAPSMVMSYSIDFVSKDTGFTTGQTGIYKTYDGAASWSGVPTGSINYDYAIYNQIQFQNSNQGCAVGYCGLLFQAIVLMTHDGGASWSPFLYGNSNSGATGVDFPNNQTGYVVGDEGAMFKTTDYGNTWLPISSTTSENLQAVDFTSATVGFAGGDNILLKTTNGGTTWTSIPGTWTQILRIQFVNDTTGYLVDNGFVYKTTDGGNTWTTNNQISVINIFFQNADTGYACSQNSIAIYKTIDGGDFWSLETADTSTNIIIGLTFSDDTTGYISGLGGIIFKTTNAGGPSFFPLNDAGMVSIFTTANCADTEAVYAVIKNYGDDTLFSSTINWSVASVNQTPVQWTGALSHYAIDTVLLGNYLFPVGTSSIMANSTLPNNVPDNRPLNDNISDSLTFHLCIPYDAAMAGMRNQFQICAGVNNIYLIIRNDGDSSLTSTTINCEVNNAPLSQFVWTGLLLPGDTTGLLLAGTYNFIQNQTYAVKAWTSLPNNHADNRPTNDTISTNVTARGLHGIYTIGGITPDYPNFTAAINDLILSGVCDTVTFDFRPGTYTENVTIPAITQASLYTPIIFQSQQLDSNTVQLNFDISQFALATIFLNGGSFMTFNELSVRCLTSSKLAVLFADSASHDVFKNCHFIGTTNTSAINTLVGTNSNLVNTGLDDDVFLNNYFQYGSNGLNFRPNDSINLISGLAVRNNIFESQHGTGLGVGFADSPKIENNIIYCTDPNGIGILVWQCFDNILVSKNVVSGNCRYGIYMDNSRIRSGNRIIISNNMIGVSPTGGNCYGIYCNHSSEFSLLNNTILNSLTGTSYYPLYLWQCNDVYSRNNIIQNNGGNRTLFYRYCNAINSDYNNLYTTGASLAYIGASSLISYNTLAAIQSATSNEMHSISVNTQYVSSTDLHIFPFYSGVNNLGIPLAEINDDIDNDIRSITPDIGADEYTPQVVTSIENADLQSGIFVFPNPANESLTISGAEINSTVLVYNELGEILICQKITSQKMVLDINQLPGGIYFLKVKSGDAVFTSKIIKE